MGKRLSKAELFQQIAAERVKLDAVLNPLTPRRMTRSGVTKAGWSVKDVLAHVVAWQQLNLGWYAESLRGGVPEVPAPGLSWKDTRELNERIYRKHHRRSLKDVLADYHTYHQEMLDLIEAVSDQDFVTIGRYDWTGPSWTLSDYVRANTASHYRWARNHIRKWVKANAKG